MTKQCQTCRYEHTYSMHEPCRTCLQNSGEFRLWEPGPNAATAPVSPDPTNPQHYRDFPVEVIQLVRHLNFNRGNAVKYVCRAGRKNLTEGQEVEDLRKAIWYLEDEIQRLTGVGDHAKP